MSDINDNSDLDECLQPYTLIRFVHKRRRRKVEQVDVIPSRWLQFDKQKKRCVTKYLEANPSEEDKLLLHTLVKNLTDPPEGWPSYTVDLVGRANTHDEGLLKIDRLESELDVFSQDFDENSINVKDNLIELVKKTKLVNELQKLDVVNESSDLAKKQNANIGSVKASSNEEVSVEGCEDNPDIKNVSINDPLSLQEEKPTKDAEKNPLLEVPVSDILRVECFEVDSAIEEKILKAIHDLKVIVEKTDKKLDRIEERQNRLMNFMMNKQLVEIEGVNFMAMYNLKVPFTNVEEFDEFNTQLSVNELLKADVCSQLSKCVDQKDFSLTKSFASLIRCFMTKETLANFTALRKAAKGDKNRRIFISTNLYKLMAGILMEVRKEKGLTYDIKDVHSALSDVISHSHQWSTKDNEDLQ